MANPARSKAMLAKDVVGRAIVLTCSVRIQEAIRRFYLTRKVALDMNPREPEMAVLSTLISPASHVADVGANVGIYTKALSSLVGVEGRVYAFEPVRNNFEILGDVVARARLGNVVLFHAALGENTNACEMVIPNRGGLSGYYWAHVASPGDEGRREKVEVLSLDRLFERGILQRLDFVKCDVEGAELEVLRGGRSLIESTRPGFLVEIEKRRSEDVFRFFFSLGYAAFVFDRSLQQVESFQDKRFSNYFFLRTRTTVSGL